MAEDIADLRVEDMEHHLHRQDMDMVGRGVIIPDHPEEDVLP